MTVFGYDDHYPACCQDPFQCKSTQSIQPNMNLVAERLRAALTVPGCRAHAGVWAALTQLEASINYHSLGCNHTNELHTQCAASMSVLTEAIAKPDWQAGSSTQWQQVRGMAKGKAAAKPAADTKPAAAPSKAFKLTRTTSPLVYWKNKYRRSPEPATSVLSAEEKAAASQLLPTPPSSEGSAELTSLRQLPLPVTTRDVAQLMHESMSRTVGGNVQLRPFVFTNIFQSAPAVAQYVAAALEAGITWQRIERFFLSSVEDDKNLAGIKVQVKGRLGKNADMASKKVWEQGQLDLRYLSKPVDYGDAQALTRAGVLGIKVWMRHKTAAAAPSMMQRSAPVPDGSLIDLLSRPRPALPRSTTAWWNIPGPAQPLTSYTWRSLEPGYSPYMPVEQYLEQQRPKVFRNDEERMAHLKQLTDQKVEDTGEAKQGDWDTSKGGMKDTPSNASLSAPA